MEINMDKQPRILIAGASGHLGNRVVEILIEQGYRNMVAASRNPEKLDNFRQKNIDIRRADFDEPSSLQEAFAGIDRLLLISTDELHAPGARIRQHTNAIDAAKKAGIRHIVYTSMPDPKAAAAIPFAPDHVATEEALEQSGLNFTSLRISWYGENLLGYLPQIIAAGKWPTVAGNGRIAYIPREDVAQATAAVLLNATEKQYMDITGVESLAIPDIAKIAGDVFGKNIEVFQVSEDQMMNELVAIGISPAFATVVVMTDLNTQAGNFDIVSDAVRQETGREPDTLKSFFTRHRDAFLRI